MAMVVKNNMSAVRTLATLNTNNTSLQDSLSKVASGLKINTAKDDASGYAISERMRVQIRSLDQANQNSQNASSLMKNAEGAVERTIDILRTLKQKAIDAASDTNTDDDRATIQKELDQFIDQIDDNALITFNGKYLLEGSRAQSGSAVSTHMTNSNLSTDTNLNTALVNLANRNGESLEINTGDRVTVSFIMGGKTYTSVMTSVENTTRIADIYKMLNTATNGGQSVGSAFADIGAETSSTANFSAGSQLTVNSTTLTSISGYAGTTGTVITNSNANVEGLVHNFVDADGRSYKILYHLEGTLLSTTTVGNADKFVFNRDTGEITQLGDQSTTTLSETVRYVATLDAVEYDGKTYALKLDQKDYDNTLGVYDDTYTNTYKAAFSNDVHNFKFEFSSTAQALTFDMTRIFNISTTGVQNSAISFEKLTKSAVLNTGTGATTSASTTLAANLFTYEDPNNTVSTDTSIGTEASGKAIVTKDGENAMTFHASSTGLEGQISGLSISISDSEGNVKKATNTALDAFKTTIYAANTTADGAVSFQIGASANQAIKVGLMDMRSEALGLKGRDGTTIQITTRAAANAAVSAFDNALNKALDQQTTIGAISARLDYTASNLTTSSENVTAAESTIRDADMAKEMTNYTKNNVLLQAAQSMLAQANQNSSAVLSLLQ